MANPAKSLTTRVKTLLRWGVVSGSLFFIAAALKQHGQEVLSLRIEPTRLILLSIALGVTLLAHIWSGWVWSWILHELHQPASGTWGVLTYLKTNIAKYLPGNVWHFIGRVTAAQAAGFSVSAATLSVLLEPLLMAAAALILALIGQQGDRLFQILGLITVLLFVHPRCLNTLLRLAHRLKRPSAKTPPAATQPLSTAPADRPIPSPNPSQNQPLKIQNPKSKIQNPPPPTPHPPSPSLTITRYPLRPLLGELIFVALRGCGFLLTLHTLMPLLPEQILPLLGGFSLAWVLGLVIPGAPGGIGVFEATAIALLGTQLSPGVVIGGVTLYRLVSTLAEAGGAGLAWLDSRPSEMASKVGDKRQ